MTENRGALLRRRLYWPQRNSMAKRIAQGDSLVALHICAIWHIACSGVLLMMEAWTCFCQKLRLLVVPVPIDRLGTERFWTHVSLAWWSPTMASVNWHVVSVWSFITEEVVRLTPAGREGFFADFTLQSNLYKVPSVVVLLVNIDSFLSLRFFVVCSWCQASRSQWRVRSSELSVVRTERKPRATRRCLKQGPQDARRF